MRGGAAGGVSAGGAVFRVRRAGDIALLVVQWVLVLLGVYVLAINIYFYLTVPDWIYPKPSPSSAENIFRVDARSTLLVQGLTVGLFAIGLGGVLFYLRRLYLTPRQ